MKATKTNPQEATRSGIRILLIIAAATVGTIGLMTVPFDTDPWWFEKLILSKTIAVAGGYAAWRLYSRGRSNSDDAMKTPNHLYIGKEDEQK